MVEYRWTLALSIFAVVTSHFVTILCPFYKQNDVSYHFLDIVQNTDSGMLPLSAFAIGTGFSVLALLITCSFLADYGVLLWTYGLIAIADLIGIISWYCSDLAQPHWPSSELFSYNLLLG